MNYPTSFFKVMREVQEIATGRIPFSCLILSTIQQCSSKRLLLPHRYQTSITAYNIDTPLQHVGKSAACHFLQTLFTRFTSCISVLRQLSSICLNTFSVPTTHQTIPSAYYCSLRLRKRTSQLLKKHISLQTIYLLIQRLSSLLDQ